MLALRSVLTGFLLWYFGAAYSYSDTTIYHNIFQATDTLPSPPNVKNLLFYIQRTSNINTIVYDLNSGSDGKPDADDPIHIYWIRYAEESQKEELTYVQKSFAYGINAKPPAGGVTEFNFVSYKKMKMYLQYSEADKRYLVYIVRSSKKVRVNRFFVKIDGGSFWFPKVTFIEIKGIDLATGKEYLERFKP